MNSTGVVLTNIGFLAKDWKIKNLEEISHLMTNGFVGTATSHYVEEHTGVLYIQGYNVEQNKFNLNGVKFVSKEFHSKHLKSQLKEGDLLTIQTGDVGLTTYVSKDLEGSNCHALIITRLKHDLCDYKFISHYLNSYKGRARLKLLEIGSTMKHLNVGDLLEFEVPLPQLKEQQKIAQALTDADNYISALEKLIEKKKQIKDGLIRLLFTDNKNWKELTLTDIAENNRALFNDGDWIEAEYITSEGIRLIQTGNIGIGTYLDKDANKKYISENSFQLLNCKELRDQDILICRLAEPAGRACLFNATSEKTITSVDVTIFRPNVEKYNRKFLVYAMSIPSWFSKISENVGGTTHKRISRSNLGEIKIKIPSLSVQNRIAQTLTTIDDQIDILSIKLEKSKSLKIGMMQKLLTGEIRFA